MHRPCALLLPLLLASLACDLREAPVPPPQPRTLTPPPSRTSGPRRHVALLDDPNDPPTAKPPAPRGPKLAWSARTAIAIADLQVRDPALYKKLAALQPNHRVGDELSFSQPELADPRAAPVLLQRLLNGNDPVAVRLALVDALPNTGGDWQEGAAALVAVDASPRVRKKLVEVLRYVPPPHNLSGLRLALHDEDLSVRVAAARTAGFTRDGTALFTELVSATFDEDWDMRAAAVQALGQLTGPRGTPQQNPARDRLVRMLTDERAEVRLQVLLALERIDPAGLRRLPDLERLARDRRSPQVAEVARRLLRERPAEPGAALPGGAATTGGGNVVANP
ncbi:MAG: HEAT repeat domain-containing protein [Nannocystis sp.]|uniref:HEAT repeat domain-containing protein n=1 Tax=Nannocystis sp. TaxID=1962667 RepID=UPI002424EE4D|nr:HEAT repeat domain-containing protein [Nannocystis sp.]MBK9756999.1 HEAT repeat domain-containing protein [Nannocystis sp.]